MKISTQVVISLLAVSVASVSFAASHAKLDAAAKSVVELKSVAEIMTPSHTVADFKAINCVGDVDITLQPNNEHKPSDIQITRDSRQKIKFTLKHNVLYIKESQHGYTGMQPVRLTIPVSYLRSLIVAGKVSVHGKDITTKRLNISADTRGVVSLDGKINVSNINAAGHSRVNLRWVEGKKLVVNSYGFGHITLSGSASQVWVNADDHSQFDGQYLRVKDIYADAKDYATMKLLPVESLHAYASGYSNVKFYKNPRYITTRGTQSANIIEVQWRK